MAICQEEILNELSYNANQNLSDVIAENGTVSSPTIPFARAVYIFEYLHHNSGFIKAVLGPKGDLSFQTKLKDFMWKELFENHRNALIKEENLRVPGRYLTSYIASALLGVIQQWLEDGKKESPQEMARILTTITIDGPAAADGLTI